MTERAFDEASAVPFEGGRCRERTTGAVVFVAQAAPIDRKRRHVSRKTLTRRSQSVCGDARGDSCAAIASGREALVPAKAGADSASATGAVI